MKHMSGVYSRPLYRLALLAAPALFLAPFAYAHLELERTASEANASVEESPAEIRLWFSERPLMFGTTIHLEDSARKLVPATDAQADRDPRQIFIRPRVPLRTGRYTVEWRAVAEDGHYIDGIFNFDVQ